MSDFEIISCGKSEITEKKSRFLGVAEKASSEAEALDILKSIQKEHYDARHNCFAYVTGTDDSTVRSSDDGEPSGTAGRPILNELQSQGVHNAIIVVTRYFGGVLLGTGGLVRAYSQAAKAALLNATLVQRIMAEEVSVTSDYNDYGKIEFLLRNESFPVINTDYTDSVTVTFICQPDKYDYIRRKITDLTSSRAVIMEGTLSAYGLTQDNRIIDL